MRRKTIVLRTLSIFYKSFGQILHKSDDCSNIPPSFRKCRHFFNIFFRSISSNREVHASNGPFIIFFRGILTATGTRRISFKRKNRSFSAIDIDMFLFFVCLCRISFFSTPFFPVTKIFLVRNIWFFFFFFIIDIFDYFTREDEYRVYLRVYNTRMRVSYVVSFFFFFSLPPR